MSSIRSLLDFICLRGCRPPITENLYRLDERIPKGKRFAYFYYSNAFIRTASVRFKNGKLEITEVESENIAPGGSPFRSTLVRELKKKTNCGSVVVHVGETESIQVISGAVKATAVADLIAISNEPKSILSQNFIPANRYASLRHPTANFSLVAACEKHVIESVVAQMAALKLTVVRVQSAMLSLLSVALAHPSVSTGKAGLLILDAEHAFFMGADESGGWKKPRWNRTLLGKKTTEIVDGKKVGDVVDTVGILDTLRDHLGDEDVKDFVVLDTKSHADVPIDQIGGIPFGSEQFDDVSIAIASACIDKPNQSEINGPLNILCGLAHDLGIVEPELTRLMPPWSRPAAVGFWAVLVAFACTGVVFQMQKAAVVSRAGASLREAGPLKQQIQAEKDAAESLTKRAALAKSLSIWLDGNPMIQPLLVNISQGLDSRAALTSILLQRVVTETTLTGVTHKLLMHYTCEPRIAQVNATNVEKKVSEANWVFTPAGRTPENNGTSYSAFLAKSKTPQGAQIADSSDSR